MRFTIILALLANVAIADTGDTAETAFRRGRAALKAGRVHEACQAFETSARLDAKVETELVLADCYEQDGRPISASRLYQKLADNDSNPDRAKRSAAKATALAARAPRLRFAITPRLEGLVIEVDGEIVSSTGDVRVDVGPHEVIARAPGFAGHASTAIDGSQRIVDVIIRLEPTTTPEPPPRPAPTTTAATPAPVLTAAMPAAPPAAPPAESPGRDHRKRNGILVGAAGAGLVVAGIVSLGVASSKLGTEHELCPGSTCATQGDLDRASALVSNAEAYRNAGIGLVIGGGALMAVGSYFVFTHAREASHVSFHPTRGGAGVTFTTSF